MFAEIALPPPESLDPEERDHLVEDAVRRIWSSGDDLAILPDFDPGDGIKLAVQPKEMWMLLLARMATRGPELKRKVLSEFVAADFAARWVIFRVWTPGSS